MSCAMAPLALSSFTLEMDEIRSGAPLPSARKVTWACVGGVEQHAEHLYQRRTTLAGYRACAMPRRPYAREVLRKAQRAGDDLDGGHEELVGREREHDEHYKDGQNLAVAREQW